MDEAAEPTVFCFGYHFFDFFESFEFFVEDALVFFLFDFEFLVLDAMLFEQVGDFGCAVDNVGELVDEEELEVLSEKASTKATTLLPR